MSIPESQQPQQLPESAHARLQSAAQGRPFFTSDLSVNQFVLVSQELPILTQALYNARELAMARMQYEGQQVGAHSVVGVSVSEDDWVCGEHAIEYFATGTAVSRFQPDANPVAPTMTMPLTN